MTPVPHTLARASRQLSLLSVSPRFSITKNAQARNAYGQIAQEIVCAALDLLPIPISGSCSVCFDAERSGHFYEIKSVKRTGKVVIYDWRMKKERAAKVPLSYAILAHNVRGSDGHDLLQEMLASEPEILLIPAHVIHESALRFPLRTLQCVSSDPRNGYNRAGYRKGYRNVPVKELKKQLPCTLYGRRFRIYDEDHIITIYTCSSLIPALALP